MAEALYRKYRPQIFEDVVGQEHIERTIKNAIEKDKVSHAYLFTGPRGTGKTTTARLLAKALLCEHGPTAEPDGTCADCEMIAAGEHPDVYELDAASRTGVENVREEIIGRVQFAPTRGRYKIYIIDEVHMLSTAAFNALLKTLEEPPSHVVFILATTDPQKVPETIHSRCQRFDFHRISSESIVSRLGAICEMEGVEFQGDALDLIAHRAEGGMRNALTSLEQLIAFGEGKVTMDVAERMLGSLDVNDLAEIVRFVGTRDVANCFRWTAEYVETGADLAQFTRDLAEHIRNMYVMGLAGADVALDVSETVRRELEAELPLFGPDRLARLLAVLGDLSAELKTSTNPRLSFEIALTRMVRPDSDLTLASLAERVEALEAGHSAVAHVVSAPAAVGGSVVQAVSAAGAQSAQAVASAQPAAAEVAPASAAAEPAMVAEPAVTAEPAAATQPAAAPQPAVAGKGEGAGAASVHAAAQPADSHPAPSGGSATGAAPGDGPAGDARVASAPATAGAQPAAQAGVVPAELAAALANPAALQRTWQAALATLKRAKAAYGVLFLNTRAVFDEAAGTLAIEFPAENDFAFKAVQKPDVQEELARAIAQAAGAPLPFTLVKAGGRGAAAAPVATQAQPVAAAAASAAQVQPAAHAQPAAGAQPAAMSAAPAAGAAQAQPAAAQPGGLPAEPSAPAGHHGIDAMTGASQQPGAAERGYGAAPWDEVPVDLYDEVPYGDDGYGAPAPDPREAAPRSGAAADAAAPAGGEPSMDDLNAALASAFGDGVGFTEV